MQALVAAISDPPSNIPSELRDRNGDPSNIMLNLQHDVGKWCTEYTWSAEDGMWGVRVLHNFGRLGMSDVAEDSGGKGDRVKVKRVDEEDAVEGGLKGRVSIGAELYFSAKERSAGGEFHLLDNTTLIFHPNMQQFQQESASQLYQMLHLPHSKYPHHHHQTPSHPLEDLHLNLQRPSLLFSIQCWGTCQEHTPLACRGTSRSRLDSILMSTATRVNGPWVRNGGCVDP